MKKIYYLVLGISILYSCSSPSSSEVDSNEPPEENRFVRDVLVSNLYEPTELVVMPDGKILFTQRRGAIKQFDPASSQYSDYDSLPVYHTNEDGLMGMALDPDFKKNSWVYLYYSPVGDEPVQNLSRFTYTSSGLTNEVLVMQVPVQREQCCHTGGSVEFGPDGLLYLSTGDNTNPFASAGFSPSDETEGRKAWDAQRSSSNTNDLRGKILRIKPERDGSYSIPEGNLFQDDDPLTRPEIYVMGCRNPYRISIDSKRNWLYWGDVGPDARADEENRGPKGHDEFNVAINPGYFGWPLFVGKNFAYRNYDFETKESGPAFDPAKPINSSPNNTGLTELPPAQPAKVYYPYGTSEVFPEVGNGGRNAMAGPVYYSEDYSGPNKFPSYLDGRVPFFDWIRGFIYFLELDDSGNPVDWYPFMPNTDFHNVIDIAFGPDGTLYMIEYGTGWFSRNPDAKLSKINFVRGNRPPILKTSLSRTKGAAPLTVEFDASASEDYDKDELQFTWEVNGETFSESSFIFTFEETGIFYPELTLKDAKGNQVSEQFTIEVGNEPPVVSIDIEDNESFFWEGRDILYSVSASDLEDDQTAEGVDQSTIVFDIAHFQSTDMAEALGHEAPINDGLVMIESMDCMSCHKVNEKSIGPSYLEVAKKYELDENAPKYLSNKIINGGGGVWGEVAMAAHPDLSVEDATMIAEYILSLANEVAYPLEGTFTAKESEGRYLFSASYEDRGKEPLKPIRVTNNKWLKPLRMGSDEFVSSFQIEARDGNINTTNHDSWVNYGNLDLTGIKEIKLFVSSNENGAKISARSGSTTGKVLGTLSIAKSDRGRQVYTIPLEASGSHELYLLFENAATQDNLLALGFIEFVPE